MSLCQSSAVVSIQPLKGVFVQDENLKFSSWTLYVVNFAYPQFHTLHCTHPSTLHSVVVLSRAFNQLND